MNKRIDEIMNSLEGIRRAEANPFLFTRVQAKLTGAGHKNAMERIVAFAGRPVFAMMVFVIVLVTNVSVIIGSSGRVSNNNEQTQLAIADEYRNSVAAYDYENPEP